MVKNVLHTLFVRVLTALVNLLIVVLTSRFLGAEGKGWYSWWILNITFTMLLSNFVGGTSLVFFVSKYQLKPILKVSYLWGGLSAFIVTLFLFSIGKLEMEYGIHFLILSVLETGISIHLYIFQGKNKITWFNWFQFSSILLFCLAFILFSLLGKQNREIVVYCFYLAKSLTLILSIFYLIKLVSTDSEKKKLPLKKLVQFGTTLQIANIAQFLNYRFSFYFLENLKNGLFYLGIFSTAVSIAEGIWIFSKSVSAVHYAEVSNSKDQSKSINSTIKLLRVTIFVVTIGIILIMCVPSNTYSMLLGSEFKDVKGVLILLVPGIFIFSLSGMVSHYFAGIGENQYAMRAALLGLIVTLVTGYILIPKYHYYGAAIVNSLSYLISTIFLIGIFWKKYPFSIADLIVKKQDINGLFQVIKNRYLRNN